MNRSRNAHNALRSLYLLGVVAVLALHSAQAASLPKTYPRLANYYLKSPISIAEARQLARWDVVILGFQLQYTSPEIFPVLRELNPDILLLAYVPSEEIPLTYREKTDPGHPEYQLVAGVPDAWMLTDASGGRLSNWPGTEMVNVTFRAPVVDGRQWNTYLPTFVHDHVMKTGCWDGIFYDNVWQNISWLNSGNIDLDASGIAESADALDAAWFEGMQSLLAYSRTLEGKDAIIIGNGGGRYYTSMNGRLIEDFPSTEGGGWSGNMKTYVDVMQEGKTPPVVVVNAKSSTGEASDSQTMRFAFTSTLLDDGFFSFDFGTQRHSDLWWYEEYGIMLGQPTGNRINLKNSKSAMIEAGVWRRDFENGIVLVNSTSAAQTIKLADAYEQVALEAASAENANTIVTEVQLAPYDGMILLRRQFRITRGQYSNGSFARSFTADGKATRQAFFTYDASIRSGAEVIRDDINRDGLTETVIAVQNKVRILNSSNGVIAEFFPYGTRYTRTLSLAVGDLDGNGTKEIVTGAGNGGGPHVRIFTNHGRPLSPGFFAYAKSFRGGVNVAVGDLDGDGKGEIVTGAGQRGGPHVRIFTPQGNALGGFFAYHRRFRGGVDVAVGDVTGDGVAEIVTAPGAGRSPHIRIVTGKGKEVLPSFFAFEKTFRGGVAVNIADVNNDLQNDILVAAPALHEAQY
jgi:hypothetical protein